MLFQWEKRTKRLTHSSKKALRSCLGAMIAEDESTNTRDEFNIAIQKEGSKEMEFLHFKEMMQKRLTRNQLKQMIYHPFSQYRLEKFLFPYHFWLKCQGQENRNWKNHYKTTFNYNLVNRIEDRISKLPDKKRKAFMRIYTNDSYEENALGMLELAKNIINHCNDPYKENGKKTSVPQRERLNIQEMEEGISSAFPELALQIFSFCLQNNINLRELYMLRLTEVTSPITRRCINCPVCDGDHCEEIDEWETATTKLANETEEDENCTSFVCNNPFAAFESSRNYTEHFHNSGDNKKKADKSKK